MKASSVFSEILKSAERRITVSAGDFYAGLVSKKMGRSTYAVTGTVDEVSKSIMSSLIKFLLLR